MPLWAAAQHILFMKQLLILFICLLTISVAAQGILDSIPPLSTETYRVGGRDMFLYDLTADEVCQITELSDTVAAYYAQFDEISAAVYAENRQKEVRKEAMKHELYAHFSGGYCSRSPLFSEPFVLNSKLDTVGYVRMAYDIETNGGGVLIFIKAITPLEYIPKPTGTENILLHLKTEKTAVKLAFNRFTEEYLWNQFGMSEAEIVALLENDFNDTIALATVDVESAGNDFQREIAKNNAKLLRESLKKEKGKLFTKLDFWWDETQHGKLAGTHVTDINGRVVGVVEKTWFGYEGQDPVTHVIITEND